MTDEQAKTLILFLALLLFLLVPVGLLDAWLYWQGGSQATLSAAVGLTGKGAPLFVAALTIPVAGGTGFLLSHWWGW